RQPQRARQRRGARLREDASHGRPAGGCEEHDAREHAARPARRSGGRRRGGTVPLLRGGGVHHGRGAPRRRRARDVATMTEMSQNGRRRVVITGVGMVTPLGNDPESTWASLTAGESGAGPTPPLDTSDYSVRFACEAKDFDPTVWIERKQARRMDKFSQLALSAARMAEADSGIDIASEPDRVGAA